MIVVKKIICDLFAENCYVVYNSTKDCVIIDPGSNFNDIVNFVRENKLNVHAVLLTHGHFDHTASCKKLQNLGFKVYISELDLPMCKNANLSYASSNNYNQELFEPDVIISNNQSSLTFGNLNVQILHVAGHSMGGLAYIVEKYLFSGDTLFKNGYGRTDLYGGSFKDIVKSVKLLLGYTKRGYILYSGHDC